MQRISYQNVPRYGNATGSNGGGGTEGTGNGDPANGGGTGGGTGDGSGGGNNNNGGGAGAGGGTQNNEPPKPPTLTAEVQAYIQQQLDSVAAKVRQEEKTKAERAAAKVKEDAEAAQAASRGEFEKLYNTEKTEHEKTKAKAEKADGYATRINEHIDAEVKSWPESVRKTDPGKDNVDARMTWVEKSRTLATELATLKRAPQGEHGGAGGRGQGAGQPRPVDKYINSTYKRPDAPKCSRSAGNQNQS